MGRLLFAVCVAMGFVTDVSAVINSRFIPVRRCKNDKAADEKGAINFTVLMDSSYCDLNARNAIFDSREYTSPGKNLLLEGAVMILDHIRGGVLPPKMAGIVWRYELQAARTKERNYTLNACQTLDKVWLRTQGSDHEMVIELSKQFTDKVTDRDVSRGAYYPNYTQKDTQGNFIRAYEELTCEFVDASLLQDSGLGLSGSAIVIPKEETTESPKAIPPKKKSIVGPKAETVEPEVIVAPEAEAKTDGNVPPAPKPSTGPTLPSPNAEENKPKPPAPPEPDPNLSGSKKPNT